MQDTITYTRTIRLRVATSRLDRLTEERLQRLMQRDDRLIRRIIAIIGSHESELVSQTRRGGYRIDSSRLHKMIYATESRKQVRYDLKQEFYPVDANSLIECRRSAEWLYKSYVVLEQKWREQGLDFKREVASRVRRHPRSVDVRRFDLVEQLSVIGIVDSTERRGQGRRLRRLWLPVELYDHALEQIQEGELRELQVVEENTDEWWIHVRLRCETSRDSTDDTEDIGIVGIDLGINKLMVMSLLTRRGVVESRVLHDSQQVASYRKVEQRRKQLISKLQYYRHMYGDNREIGEIDHDAIDDINEIKRLQQQLDRSRSRVKHIKLDLDRKLVAQLADHLQRWQSQYNLDLHIFIGDLTGINFKADKSKQPSHYQRLKRWSYRRLTAMVEQKMAVLGLSHRFFKVHEYYTSSRCHRCRKQGVRPSQDRFYCSYERCAWKGNADINASINIAKQGIYYLKLRNRFHDSKIEQWLAPSWT